MLTAKIVMSSHGRGEVFIDGQKISKLKGFKFEADGAAKNILTLIFLPEKVEIDADEIDVTNLDSTEREFQKVR